MEIGMEIDYSEFLISYARLANRDTRRRVSAGSTEASELLYETHVRKFFTMIAEVIEWLNAKAALPQGKMLLPATFSVRPTPTGSHLTISRELKDYDGRCYAIDWVEPNEDLGTIVANGTLDDLDKAVYTFLPLLECIVASDQRPPKM